MVFYLSGCYPSAIFDKIKHSAAWCVDSIQLCDVSNLAACRSKCYSLIIAPRHLLFLVGDAMEHALKNALSLALLFMERIDLHELAESLLGLEN